jgi:hypothetical protein
MHMHEFLYFERNCSRGAHHSNLPKVALEILTTFYAMGYHITEIRK